VANRPARMSAARFLIAASRWARASALRWASSSASVGALRATVRSNSRRWAIAARSVLLMGPASRRCCSERWLAVSDAATRWVAERWLDWPVVAVRCVVVGRAGIGDRDGWGLDWGWGWEVRDCGAVITGAPPELIVTTGPPGQSSIACGPAAPDGCAEAWDAGPRAVATLA